MTLTELRYIVALAAERHFGRSAEKCFVSQPTLSVAVKKLEQELGITLFERSKSHISVTETGARVIEQARRVLDQVSIISDIDDTVKISEVTDRRQLLENTFFKAFQSVPGMSELYRDLVARGARLHFVSSSPWQLYPPLRDFLLEAGFPWASLDLKSIRFRDQTLLNLFKEGTETKPEQIIPILQRYPERIFILIGDSGEHDPEVYGDIARRFPDSIQRILIRSLDSAGRDNARYQDAFKSVPAHKWQLFDSPDQLSAGELIELSQ